MATLEPVNFRIEPQNKERLRKLAKGTGRDQSELAREALNQYLDVQEWQIEGIRRALESVENGDFADDADIDAAFKRFDR